VAARGPTENADGATKEHQTLSQCGQFSVAAIAAINH